MKHVRSRASESFMFQSFEIIDGVVFRTDVGKISGIVPQIPGFWRIFRQNGFLYVDPETGTVRNAQEPVFKFDAFIRDPFPNEPSVSMISWIRKFGVQAAS